MSRSKNTIPFYDISTTPVKLKYYASYTSQSFTKSNISITKGVNGPVTKTGSVSQETVNYRLVRQLYYQNYLTGSLLNSTSSWDWNQQSTACSGSSDYENRRFPTESNARITYIYMPPSVIGEQISRNSLSITSSQFDIKDDGNGNLIDYSIPANIGNVIYSQGMTIITTGSHVDLITSSFATWSFNGETTIYQNEYRCHISENDFNYTQNPSAIVSGTLGTYLNAITGSDFRPYITTVGLYNQRDELLVVGKLSTPYPVPPNTDMTFVVRYDS
jgi:hypothetical protein